MGSYLCHSGEHAKPYINTPHPVKNKTKQKTTKNNPPVFYWLGSQIKTDEVIGKDPKLFICT